MTIMRGQKALFEVLVSEGVECLFGNPGSTELGFYDELENYPQIKFYLGLHEAVVMGMADGYARATGKPALVNVHIAPGLANSMSMLFNAYSGGTPLVVTAGQQYTEMLMGEPILAADLVSMARPFTKWSVEVMHPEDVPMVMRKAFKVAATPPFGPVFVSIPADTLVKEADFDLDPANKIHFRTRPDNEAVVKATDLLSKADRPVMVVGDGVAQSRAMSEAVKLAEVLGARVYASPMRSEVNFPTTHPQYLGTLNLLDPETISAALGNVDVLFAIGTSVFPVFMNNTPRYISKDTQLIHLDSKSWEIGKIYPVELGIVADPREGMKDLTTSINDNMQTGFKQKVEDRNKDIEKERKILKEAAEAIFKTGWDNVPITEGRIMSELRDCLPPETILIDVAVTASIALNTFIDFPEEGTMFGLRGGSLGWGLPGALGIKIAQPDRPVVAVIGDGEAMFTIQALWTAAHYNIPVTFVIIGNASYEIVKINMINYLNAIEKPVQKSKFMGMQLTDPTLDYAKLANAFGIPGRRVEDPAELSDALKEAISIDGPSVVDILAESTTARIARSMK